MADSNTNPMVSLQIDKAMLQQAVEKQVGNAVATAILGKEELLDKMIKDILNCRVDDNGKPYYNGRHTYMEYLGLEVLRKAIRDGLQDVMSKKQVEITAAVEKHLLRSKNVIAKALMDGMVDSLKSRWTSHVTFSIKTED